MGGDRQKLIKDTFSDNCPLTHMLFVGKGEPMQLKGTAEGDSNFLVQVPFCVDKEVVEAFPFQSQLKLEMGGGSVTILTTAP